MKAAQRVLFLSKYARSGASSRYRSFQYLPFLEQAGLDYKVSPLFDDAYLANRYRRGSGSMMDIVRACLCRIGALVKVRDYGLVVIEYELLPYFPALLERWLKWMGVSYVVDYDDALFHQYDRHRNPLIRWLLGGKIAVVMRYAEVVVAGNSYLADYARKAGAKRVEVIPTVIDLERYPIADLKKEGGAVTIGWIGSPTTAKYLQIIAPALAEICKNRKAKLRLIGSGAIKLPGVDVEVLPWSEVSEVELMHTFDIGIMPLPDESWARGKCGFKLIQYMACGLPVIASPVGVNSEIVEHGINGFLASTQDEWIDALKRLIVDAALRGRMGRYGRSRVGQQYCLQVIAPKLIGLLSDVARGKESGSVR